MAFQLAPRTSSVCSQSPYSNFLPLQGFAPAVSFCTAFEVNPKSPSISGCPSGNALCKVLSSLSSCELTVISQACICIGVTPSTTISVPKTTASSTSPAKTTSQSSLVKSSPTKSSPTTTNSWTSINSSPSTWATSTKATDTCSPTTVTVTTTPSICLPSTVTVTTTPSICLPSTVSVTVTVTPTTCQPSSTTTTSAPGCTPICIDGATPAYPPPAGAICQQTGTLNPTNWELITDGSASSVSGCAAQCLADVDCLVSEYDSPTQDCQLFSSGNATELGFVAVAGSPFVVSDVGCFVAC